MSCKFKDSENKCLCLVTNGECQFLENDYDNECPIFHAFDKLKPDRKDKTE